MEYKYDVIVLGGGTAGVIAAIAAARNKAKTLVIEKNSYLGGAAATGIPFLGIFDGCDEQVNKGIPWELVQRMKAQGGSLEGCFGGTWEDGDNRFSITPFEHEVYKYVAQEMILEAGAEILFHTFISDVIMENEHLQAVETVNKSGKHTYTAKVFIDATGDADIAYLCGVPMLEKRHIQNASMLFKLGGVDMQKFYEALQTSQGVSGWGNWHNRVLMGPRLDTDEIGPIHLAGHFIGERGEEITFTAVSTISNEVSLNATRTVGVNGASAEDLTSAEIQERRNVQYLINCLKKNTPGFENSRLIYTAPMGIRESRNIIGDYQLQQEDVISGREFEDSIARGAYPIDIHDPKGGRTQFTFIHNKGSYTIPYRSLLPKGVENLLVAGRCLSATHEAMGTARIMGAAMSQGQAAGTAAALAVENSITLRELNIKKLQQQLVEDHAII